MHYPFQILREKQLLQLRTLGVENLTRAISSARKEFMSLPSAITTQTEQVREGTYKIYSCILKSPSDFGMIIVDTFSINIFNVNFKYGRYFYEIGSNVHKD